MSDGTEEEVVTSTTEVVNRHGGYLPPLHRIKIPDTTTASARIRWLWEVGYEVKEISKGLGIRYQQVRNIITTQPKRAAREDLPPLDLVMLDMEDVVDTLLGGELERTFQQDRQQQAKAVKAKAAKSVKPTTIDIPIGRPQKLARPVEVIEEEEVDEITEILDYEPDISSAGYFQGFGGEIPAEDDDA